MQWLNTYRNDFTTLKILVVNGFFFPSNHNQQFLRKGKLPEKAIIDQHSKYLHSSVHLFQLIVCQKIW